MLSALCQVAEPEEISAVVNTGDDVVMHGLHVCPDLDTVTYTLAGLANPETGWGLAGETWGAMSQLRRLSGERLAWFNLGDKDLGTHLYRTSRLAEGATLAQVTTEIARSLGVRVHITPMTNDPVRTKVVVSDEDGEDREVGFQEYFVARRHAVPVRSVRFEGIGEAQAAPGVLEAIQEASLVVICPSNPVVSVAPVLACGGIGAALARRRQSVVAVSPLVGGRALKGPADRLLSELGFAPGVAGVAQSWSQVASVLLIDPADAQEQDTVRAKGMEPLVVPTVMDSPEASRALAEAVLCALSGPPVNGEGGIP